MIEGLIKSSLHTRLLVFILAVFVAAAGWYSYSNLTIEAFPDPTDTQVQVITIYPGQPKGGEIRTYGDHRVAMAFGLMGLRVPGIVVDDRDCVGKTFAEYWDVRSAMMGA